MTFQAYLDTIQAQTGKTADDFRKLAAQKGLARDGRLLPTAKAGDVVAWLREDFDLGRGHAMAIYALLKGAKKEGDA
jgi:Domain of unknown function (DUF4287)